MADVIEAMDTNHQNNFHADERDLVEALISLCVQTVLNQVELQQEIYKLEKSLERKHFEIYDQRIMILKKYCSIVHPDSPLHNFWLRVFRQSSLSHFISNYDEKIFAYLMDVRCVIYLQPIAKFVLEFYFMPNSFFTNSILTKNFCLSRISDLKSPLDYEGDKLISCHGCAIHWRSPYKEFSEDVNENEVSFFEFFENEKSHTISLQNEYRSINEVKKCILQNSLKIGIYIKDHVIPSAIFYFTGEINEQDIPIDEEWENDIINLQDMNVD